MQNGHVYFFFNTYYVLVMHFNILCRLCNSKNNTFTNSRSIKDLFFQIPETTIDKPASDNLSTQHLSKHLKQINNWQQSERNPHVLYYVYLRFQGHWRNKWHDSDLLALLEVQAMLYCLHGWRQAKSPRKFFTMLKFFSFFFPRCCHNMYIFCLTMRVTVFNICYIWRN